MTGPGSVRVRPFAAADITEAGRLLAARHARHRRTEPLLADRYETAAEAQQEVAAAWGADGASGAVATSGGRTVGYLLGAPKPESTWGENTWVESAGIAAEHAEVARDLYALAAQRWVDEGRCAHYVLVPSHDNALVDAWFRLGFGLQHVHAVREPLPGSAMPPGVRRARRDDAPALASLDLALPRHQGRSPVFSSGGTPSYDEALVDAGESVDDPDLATFVLERGGAVVGTSVGCALRRSRMHRGPALVEEAGFLGFAAVLPEARGRGAGRALGEAVLAWCGEQGYRGVVTDWRAANLLSSRAWARLDFRPTFFRLHRVVGF